MKNQKPSESQGAFFYRVIYSGQLIGECGHSSAIEIPASEYYVECRRLDKHCTISDASLKDLSSFSPSMLYASGDEACKRH